jgi:hypothetical protein
MKPNEETCISLIPYGFDLSISGTPLDETTCEKFCSHAMFIHKSTFNSLEETTRNPGRCKKLNLLFVKMDFADAGPRLLALKNLRELFIQGDHSIFDNDEFTVPPEIGELTKLRRLSLLNVPLRTWPTWILKLRVLEYLMIRGTDIDSIPPAFRRWIN